MQSNLSQMLRGDCIDMPADCAPSIDSAAPSDCSTEKENSVLRFRELTDAEWALVEPLLPELRPRRETRGRPMADTRTVLNGVLWVMFTGLAWSSLPSQYPSYQTCHRRFKQWYESGVINLVAEVLSSSRRGDLSLLISTRVHTLQSAYPSTAQKDGSEGISTLHLDSRVAGAPRSSHIE
jgi:transposase